MHFKVEPRVRKEHSPRKWFAANRSLPRISKREKNHLTLKHPSMLSFRSGAEHFFVFVWIIKRPKEKKGFSAFVAESLIGGGKSAKSQQKSGRKNRSARVVCQVVKGKLIRHINIHIVSCQAAPVNSSRTHKRQRMTIAGRQARERTERCDPSADC